FRHFIGRDQHFGQPFVFVYFYAKDLGRLQGSLNKFVFVVGIIDDINIFVAELAHYSMNPDSFHSHTGPDRIDPLIVRYHSHFRAVTGFAGNFFQFDDAVIDFRDFILKKPFQEKRRGTRYDDGWISVVAFHLADDRTDCVAFVVAVFLNLLFSWHNQFHAVVSHEHLAETNV